MSDDSFIDWESSDDFVDEASDSFAEPSPPKKKKAPAQKPAKGTAAKRVAKKPLLEDSEDSPPKPKKSSARKPQLITVEDDDDDDDINTDNVPAPSKQKRTVEEEYTMLELREHVLKRPDTYIGSVRTVEEEQYVYDEERGMILKTVSYPPGLYKIFDEILVNAADNYQRDPSMKIIRVNIDVESNTISVYNDGEAIPVTIHEQHKMYVPEMIFGHLLTGSNFDDAVERVTGGRNGLGAKLTNIYSLEFTVETADKKHGKKFKMTWRNNMTEKTQPVISKAKEGESWTRITFKPDLAKFGMSKLSDDIVALMKRRVYDVAGCNSGLNVYFNDKRIAIKSFTDYVKLFYKSMELEGKATPTLCFEKIVDKSGRRRWEICFAVSDGEFKHMSFVNSIATSHGGTHIAAIAKRLTDYLLPIIAKKNKQGVQLKPAQVKNHFWLFVNALINNPEFSSQTKQELTSGISTWGTRPDLSEKFLKQVEKSGIIEQVISWAQRRTVVDLKKTGGKKKSRPTGIAKLDDANNAGTKNAQNCTLILTEGDSAKALAVSGLAVVGRDNFGVFPLRGKFLNVREASHSKVIKNEEINALKQILGLQHGVEYTSAKDLRYGHVMIMADQDHDGSHIKGLIINFFHHFWPSLTKLPGFITEFITPIVKVSKGKTVKSFYSIPEFEKWKAENNTKGWKIKYYKGLGTSTAEEAREYFRDLNTHRKEFKYVGREDDEAITLAFNKKLADKRKEWLRNYVPGTYLDPTLKKIPYNEFVNKELILFSLADCVRSIPSIVDGWKPGQRKILFCCFKRNLKSEIRVAQLAGYVSEHSAYHHGEASLHATIVGMAQNFVGSNNLNVLEPIGQFGTRLQGGKDAASARYIHTCLSKLARFVFHPDDDPILNYLEEDGESIEPEWYVPILPMILVNGNTGVGTGWSSNVPNFNPRDITANLRRLIRGESPKSMHPWYRGFKGTIEWDESKHQYRCRGVWQRLDEDTLEITELPIGVWVYKYKEWLEKCIAGDSDQAAKKTGAKKTGGGDKKKKKKKDEEDDEESEESESEIDEPDPALVSSYKEYHTDTRVHFIIKSPILHKLTDEQVEAKFYLNKSINITNMHLFDAHNRIKKYSTPLEILEDFYQVRLAFYQKRKDYLVGQLEREWKILENKVRFITAVINKELIVSNRKKKDLIAELIAKKYDPFPKKATKSTETTTTEEESEEEEEDDKSKDYDYLLSMPIWSLTLERVQKLKQQLAEKKAALDELLDTKPTTIWERDLDAFDAAWEQFEEEMERKEEEGGGPKKPKKVIKKETKPLRLDDSEDVVSTKKRKEATPKPLATVKPKPEIKQEVKQEIKEEIKEETNVTEQAGKSSKLAFVELSDSDDVKPPVKRKKTAAKRAAAKPEPEHIDVDLTDLPKKSTVKTEVSEDESKSRPSRPRRAAAAKVKYTASDEESEDFMMVDSDSDVDLDEDAGSSSDEY